MFTSPAFAQTAGAASGGAPSGFAAILASPLPMMIGVAVIFYFLLVRPQQQRAKQVKAMLEAMKKGDVVVTAGGLIGRVVKVDGEEVEVELAPAMKVRAVRSTISEVRGTAKPAND
jgi:preprotein translocase subunit YajC